MIMMVFKEKQPANKKQISSGIIIFEKTKEGPRFLILYYGHGYWTFPRGKIEKEERSFEAALRETKEETGIIKQDLKIFSNFKTREKWTFVRDGQKIDRIIIFYLAETNNSIDVKISHEHRGFGWFTYREAVKIFAGLKNSENRRIIKQAYNFVKSREGKNGEEPVKNN